MKNSMINILLKRTTSKIRSRIQFRSFEAKIHKKTWDCHSDVLRWAEQLAMNEHIDASPALHKPSVSALADYGLFLKNQALKNFKLCRQDSNIRMLIHLPSKAMSPGGYSAFYNLAQSLSYIGVNTQTFLVGEDVAPYLQRIKPNILISSDSANYISALNWDALNKYKKNNSLRIGLTASLEEYGNSPLTSRLNFAKKNKIDFFYSFRSPEYIAQRVEYKQFLNNGFRVLTVEFAANPLLYFPIDTIEKDLDFVFLASSNPDKLHRYLKWLPSIVNNNRGFIDGPGWKNIARWATQPTHRYIYARAKVGINLHIDDSIYWPSELNERTYILAACGVPQLIDNPMLLDKRFSSEAMFVAKNPAEYFELYNYMLNNSAECERRATIALKDVYQRHTTFHRALSFLEQLEVL